jgi:hypothetical protein
MKRQLTLSLLVLSLAGATLAAQSTEGWKVRADRSMNAADPDAAGDIQFMAMGNGFHCVNPTAAVFWHPDNTATGTYTLKGTFTLMEPSNHTNYYGLVFGGSDLEGADQSYTYFMVAQNGAWLLKRRAGNDSTENITEPTQSDAVKTPDAGGTSVNDIEVRVKASDIDYVVNGTVVHTTPRAGVTTDGLYGFRVNHRLNVTVEGFGVTP